MATIKLKRGLSANVNTSNAADGEILMTTDTNELYRGTGAGNAPVRLGVDKTIVDNKVTSLEEQTFETIPVTIAKTNFIMNTLLSTKTKELHQMVIDTLEDSTNISSSLSFVSTSNELIRYKRVGSALYGLYDLTTGGSTITNGYTVNGATVYGPQTGTMSQNRTNVSGTSLSNLFDDLTTTTAADYWGTTTKPASFGTEDALTFNFGATGVPINRVIVNPFVSSVYLLSAQVWMDSGSGLANTGSTFTGSGSVTTSSTITINNNTVKELRFRATAAGTTGYGVAEVEFIPTVAYVVTNATAISASTSKIVLTTEEDLTLSGSSVTYHIAFGTTSNFTPASGDWKAITKDTLFTNVTSGSTFFRLRASLNNGAGLSAYAVAWA